MNHFIKIATIIAMVALSFSLAAVKTIPELSTIFQNINVRTIDWYRSSEWESALNEVGLKMKAMKPSLGLAAFYKQLKTFNDLIVITLTQDKPFNQQSQNDRKNIIAGFLDQQKKVEKFSKQGFFQKIRKNKDEEAMRTLLQWIFDCLKAKVSSLQREHDYLTNKGV